MLEMQELVMSPTIDWFITLSRDVSSSIVPLRGWDTVIIMIVIPEKYCYNCYSTQFFPNLLKIKLVPIPTTLSP